MFYTIAYDRFIDPAGVPLKKAVRNSLALLAASVAMSGAAQAQDKAALAHQNVAPDATARITLEAKTGPTLAWSSRTQVSGLFVDLVKPQQTWAMLNPAGPARDLSAPIPPYLLPITAPRSMNDNLVVHEPGIALLQFNF